MIPYLIPATQIQALKPAIYLKFQIMKELIIVSMSQTIRYIPI